MDKKTLLRLRELLDIALEVETPEAYYGLTEAMAHMLSSPGELTSEKEEGDNELSRVISHLTEIWKTGSVPLTNLPGTAEQQALLAGLISEISGLQRIALDLCQGDLSSSPILGGLTGEYLKRLQAHLQQVTRQTKKITEGDFRQRIDFWDGFSSSFNTIIQRLAESQDQLKEVAQELVTINTHLKEEIDKRKRIESELKHYHTLLENLSVTDGLTGIANRRRFDEFLMNEWRRSVRYRTPLSLILLDIDFFKAFNDHYGHLAGDDCLRQVAMGLKEIIQRPGDLSARFGGEEFACILTVTQAKGARSLAEQIVKKIQTMNIPHKGSSVADRVTVSMGVVTIFPTVGQQPLELLQRADELLYEAKGLGRNRIRVWPDPDTKKKAS
jgi:diguanylate cyclase (GGDEF)-like protein